MVKMVKNYDFCGWATRNNTRCSDGRTILRDAFKDCDGAKVPLVWGHNHTDPNAVLGHAILENRDEGVYAYGFLNETESGENAKLLLQHGDIASMSIWANNLVEKGGNVLHGLIREVSLVLAGANPGALIDSVIVHSDGSRSEDREQGIFYSGEELSLAHSEDEKAPETREKDERDDPKQGETVGDIIQSMTDKQKVVMYAMVEEAIKENNSSKKTDDSDKAEPNKEENEMKHNIFDKETEQQDRTLAHADQMQILNLAKNKGVGSLRAALELYDDQNSTELAHADLGINSVSQLFPEYKNVKPGAPELVTDDQTWISKVLAKVHKSPMSRLRTRQVDARDITAIRATGYTKGKEKKFRGNLDLLNRTTDPQTIYVKSKLDRDDIVDIVDFDYVSYMYQIDRMALNEELATAILVGDGRTPGSEGKISEDKIRPIWKDDELYTIHVDVDLEGMKTTLNGTNTGASFGEEYIYAEAIIRDLLYAREQYKGSGNPDFFCEPHLVNMMLMARDMNGRRIYGTIEELRAALNVKEIITVEQFQGLTRTDSESKKKKLLGLMVNLSDYTVGATKGGEIAHFTDFDLNFNQEISLLETRVSGSNLRIRSAIALEEDITDKE